MIGVCVAFAPQRADDVEAGNIGQAKIQNDDVRLLRRNRRQPVPPIPCLKHLEPFAPRLVRSRRRIGGSSSITSGDEAGGGVQRQVRRHCGHALRVQRQNVLKAQHGIERQKPSKLKSSILVA